MREWCVPYQIRRNGQTTPRADSLRLAGEARIEIARKDDVVTIQWDGRPFLKDYCSEPLQSLVLFFNQVSVIPASANSPSS